MSLHASLSPPQSQGGSSLKVAMGFEDGRVELWALGGSISWKSPSDGRTGMTPWQRRYEGKRHNEASESSRIRCAPFSHCMRPGISRRSLQDSHGNDHQFSIGSSMDSISRSSIDIIRPHLLHLIFYESLVDRSYRSRLTRYVARRESPGSRWLGRQGQIILLCYWETTGRAGLSSRYCPCCLLRESAI